MIVNLTPFRNFPGAARETVEAYQRILGGEVQFVTFGDMPGNDASGAELIMHSELRIDGKPMPFAPMLPGRWSSRRHPGAILLACSPISSAPAG